jgi:hypothetical protein
MKTEKRAQQIAEKITRIRADKSQVIATYQTRDESVQTELRLSASWKIRVPVDEINYPRDLSGGNGALWSQMSTLAWDITKISTIMERRMPERYAPHAIRINERTKTGPERRAEAKNLWLIEAGNAFMADYRLATKKSSLAKIRKQIAALQAQQKALIPALRESNSLHLSGKKTEREAQKQKNADALKTGRFWEADQETLKGYFHPPFDKNYLADVSEKWRAALFLECESVSYKGYNNEWRHKLSGTGDAYLCGIDDNGDEWGHRCHVGLSRDNYGNGGFDATVEDAMSDLFDIAKSDLAKCQRQGDLLFCPEAIPAADRTICAICGETESEHHNSVRILDEEKQITTNYLACYFSGNYQEYKARTIKAPILDPSEKWTPRESHDISSPSLRRNGRYFAADHEITVSHTSHAVVTLPPSEYRLYMSTVVDPVD